MENTRDLGQQQPAGGCDTDAPEDQEIKEWLDFIRKHGVSDNPGRNLVETNKKVDQLIGILKKIQPMITDLKVHGDRSEYALRPMLLSQKCIRRKKQQ